MTVGNTEKVELTGAKETLLFTLYGRALDYRSKSPILGDRWASDVLDRIEYGNRLKVKLTAGDRFIPVLRAKRMDEWARAYLAAHPDAVVLHLACGLDSRVFRIDPPASVLWYDLDYPEIVDLRKRLYPERDGYQLIASSVTDPGWLEQIPADRPVLVIAEGLMMYLTQADVQQLLLRLLDRFSEGELIFDVMSRWFARASKLAGYTMWGLDDPHEIERWSPRLTLVDDAPTIAEYEQIPIRRYRLPYQIMSSTGIRKMIRPLHFRFE